jgi:hypothetical protein
MRRRQYSIICPLTGNGCRQPPKAHLFEASYGLILAIVIVVVVVMFAGMLSMPLAMALIMPMNPFVMVFPPMPRYPHPFVATVPIARTLVIWPITHLDREPDRHGVWPDNHANRQESHRKNRKFRFHKSLQIIRMKVIS